MSISEMSRPAILAPAADVLDGLGDEALGGPVHQDTVGHFSRQFQHLGPQGGHVDGHPFPRSGGAE